MADLGIDLRIEQIKAEEQKVAEQFFAGELSVMEEVHRQQVLAIERIKLQGIKDYAEFYGLDPEKVSVTTAVDGVSNTPIYSVKP